MMIDFDIIERIVKDFYVNNFVVDFPKKTIVNGKSVPFESVLVDFFVDLGVMLSDIEYVHLLHEMGAYFSQLSSYKENIRDKINHQDRIAKAIESLEALLGDHKDYRHISMIGLDTDSNRTVHVDWNPKDYKTTIDFLNMAASWSPPSKTRKPTREHLKEMLRQSLIRIMGFNPPPKALDKLSRAI